ncbi:MAG: hypothetical protein U9N49_01890 [Campylobacterota bacterium]|nr:hypothetical protein [Campylobacterota bacterium]
MMRYIIVIGVFLGVLNAKECQTPSSIASMLKVEAVDEYQSNRDIYRNLKDIKSLCLKELSFKEGKYHWKMLLVWNPQEPKGAFWYLPHDDENAAFDSAVYATRHYGGGFLAVINRDRRVFAGQDPNRNFGTTATQARICSQQKHPAPLYVKTIFSIIDSFRDRRYPYLTLHTNSNGHSGNGGAGHISMLKKGSTVLSFPAATIKRGKKLGLSDEDSLIYIATKNKKPNMDRVKRFNDLGINVKYELVNPRRNDCSMSNYVVLELGSEAYINIEVEHGDGDTQKVMIDKVLSLY